METVPEDIVVERGEYWQTNVRENDQTLLGTCVIALRRHAYELDQLEPAEEQELVLVRNGLIAALRSSFRPTTFNISCLKNDAFRDDPDGTPPQASHVHWHVKPRYASAAIKFADDIFLDPLPGRYLESFNRKSVTHETAVQIAEVLKRHLA
jgi:diadenosine tetraphosphate (Ap4A) HIT family hydrolase